MSNSENPWSDPKILIAIGGLTIGFLGLLFGLFRDRWSRRESRLDALGKLLHPLVRAAQDLMRANNARRTAEQLQHSYPLPRQSTIEGVEAEKNFPEATPEVIERVNSLFNNYKQHLKSSEQNFRDAESEFATRHFRFPTRIAKQIKELQECLSELGPHCRARSSEVLAQFPSRGGGEDRHAVLEKSSSPHRDRDRHKSDRAEGQKGETRANHPEEHRS